jgi:acyl-ACP thioesterase
MSRQSCKYGVVVRTMQSMCDRKSHMRIPAMHDLFQDIAGLHTDSLGIGVFDLEEKGLFWIVSKLKLKIARRPRLGETLDAATWMQPADRATCERDWSVSEDGEQLAYLKSIWAVIGADNFKPARMSDFYPDIAYDIDRPDEEPFARIDKDFSKAERIGEYRVRSVDIDSGGHMSNANYVRAMLGFFSNAEIEEIKELDLRFLLQCYEGDTIRFVKRASKNGLMDIAAINSEGNVCFISTIK